MTTTISQSKGKWWKWYICAILFLATVLCYLDRQTMALCAALIKEDFELDNEQWGNLLGAFRATYGYMQIAAGYIVDERTVLDDEHGAIPVVDDDMIAVEFPDALHVQVFVKRTLPGDFTR